VYNFFSQIGYALGEPFLILGQSIENIPLLSAFLLGIVGSLVPCQFTGNLGAITIYGNKTLQKGLAWSDVLFFILGKIVVFSGLGFIVWLLGSEFEKTLTVYFPWIRKIVGPLLIMIGLFMIGIIKIKGSVSFGSIPERFMKKGKLGSFLMGVSFTLGFCPTMFVLFFVTLMPMALSSSYGVMLPSIFALGTSLPLIIAIFLLWYFELSGKFMNQSGRKIGLIVQKVTGWMMIIIGVIDTLTYWGI
jgi:cytochrome c-type biogenesis protein